MHFFCRLIVVADVPVSLHHFSLYSFFFLKSSRLIQLSNLFAYIQSHSHTQKNRNALTHFSFSSSFFFSFFFFSRKKNKKRILFLALLPFFPHDSTNKEQSRMRSSNAFFFLSLFIIFLNNCIQIRIICASMPFFVLLQYMGYRVYISRTIFNYISPLFFLCLHTCNLIYWLFTWLFRKFTIVSIDIHISSVKKCIV